MTKRSLLLLRLASLAILAAEPAVAQTPEPATQANGTIIGVITDAATGQPVAGALIVATSPALQGEQTALTDGKGAFRIPNLPAGRYRLAVDLDGFNPAARGDVNVAADTTLRANLALVPSAVQMEEVVVTGSRIRRKDLTTPAPVTVINSEQLQQSGRVTVGEFLQTLPEQGNAVNNQVNNGGAGSTQVDLRGLSPLRTLVLVNGRRMVFTGIGGNTGTGVDLNMIPTAVIERIEVLKDGASAVYGSDAVAGVVNVITRRNFSGTEFNATTGISDRGDGAMYDLNATTGTSNDRGGVVFSLGYADQRQVWATDRPITATPSSFDFLTGQPVFAGSFTTPNGVIVSDGAPGNDLWNALNAANPDGVFTFDSATQTWRGFVDPDDLYNFQVDNLAFTPMTRLTLYSAGDYKLLRNARGYFEASLVNRESKQLIAPEPLTLGAGGAPIDISAANIYNPFGRDFVSTDTLLLRRLVEFGRRDTRQDLDTWRAVAGFDGTLPESAGPLRSWFWDVSLNYGRTQGIHTNRGNLVSTQIANAVGPSFLDPVTGAPTCGTPTAPIANCVPLNLFGGAGSITPDQTTNLTFTGVSQVRNELLAVQANFSGQLFRLFAERPVGLAFGYEHRRESGSDIPDPFTAAGLTTGNARIATEGQFHVNEGYGELSIPLVGGLPFVQELEVVAAARVFDYSTFGGDWTYKLGGRWQIVPAASLRGTYSTAFRAPAVQELFQGLSDDFPNVTDPCADLSGASPSRIEACLADGVPAGGSGDDRTQMRAQIGGNPLLEPETARIWTAGIVLEPRRVKNLSLTLDFYNIEVNDSIGQVGASFIVDQCYPEEGARDEQYCSLVERDASGRINNIRDVNVNVGGYDTSGLDFAVRYRRDTRLGAFGFIGDANYLFKYDITQPDGFVVKGKGNYDVGILNGGHGGVYPNFKANAGVTWGRGGLGAGVNGRYISSFEECGDEDGVSGALCSVDGGRQFSRRVDDYLLFDAFVSYGFRTSLGRTSLALGVRNVFDTTAPIIYSAFTEGTSDPYNYDMMGRFIYLNAGLRL